MKKTGLIQLVLEAVGLDDGMVKGKFTPSEQRPLVKYADVQVGCSAIVALLAYFSIFQVILIHIQPFLSIPVHNTCLLQKDIMSWHLKCWRNTRRILRTVVYCWIQIMISSKLMHTLTLTLQEFIGNKSTMIWHVQRVALVSLLRFLIVLFCGFLNCRLKLPVLKWKQR